MDLNPSKSSNLEHLALKGLKSTTISYNRLLISTGLSSVVLRSFLHSLCSLAWLFSREQVQKSATKTVIVHRVSLYSYCLRHVIIIIIRPRRSRQRRSWLAAYSHQTFPWTTCRSVGRCVGLSSALWKNDGSDPDTVWHHRSDGYRNEAGSGVWVSVYGKGYFWGRIWGAPL